MGVYRMSENSDNIQFVQGKLAEMAQLARACENGLEVVGEAVEVDDTTKDRLKQKLNAMRVECVTALNQVRL
jgi:hypothetical protein